MVGAAIGGVRVAGPVLREESDRGFLEGALRHGEGVGDGGVEGGAEVPAGEGAEMGQRRGAGVEFEEPEFARGFVAHEIEPAEAGEAEAADEFARGVGHCRGVDQADRAGGTAAGGVGALGDGGETPKPAAVMGDHGVGGRAARGHRLDREEGAVVERFGKIAGEMQSGHHRPERVAGAVAEAAGGGVFLG